MEKLAERQRQRENKMSNARIVQKSPHVGIPAEVTERPALLAAKVEFFAAGKKPTAAVATVSQFVYDAELEKLGIRKA